MNRCIVDRRTRVLVATLALAGLAVFICGCDDDPPPAPPVPAETEYVFTSDRYLNNRFFRLDLANAEGVRAHDVPGRNAILERIRYASVHVFQLLPSGSEFRPEDVGYLAAYTDTTGVFWATPDCPPNDFQSPGEYGDHWREIVEYDAMVDMNGSLTGIDLRVELADADVLAVCYDVEDVYGNILYRIGDVLYTPPSTVIPGQEHLYHRAKLLKAPVTRAIYPFHYVLRNIYSLGRENIDPNSFRLSIEGDVHSMDPTVDESGLPYIRLFGLDRYDRMGYPGPDGLADFADAFMFNFYKGLLRFPLEEPFAAGEAAHAIFADSPSFVWNGTYLQYYQAAGLYDPLARPYDYRQFGYFTVRAVYRDDPGE